MNVLAKIALVGSLVSTIAGCASEAEETASSESELNAAEPSGAEVVGALRMDMEAQQATSRADGGYRAFAFDAMGSFELVAHVVASSNADPVAYILDANRRVVKQNDNRSASTKDAEIRFTTTTTGTYYLAFRSKDLRAVRVMARIYNASSEAAQAAPRPTGTFVDSWPLRSSTMSGTDSKVFDVDVYGAGTVSSNPNGCPGFGLNPGTGRPETSAAAKLSFRVDLKNRLVTMPAALVDDWVPLFDDGTFSIDKTSAQGTFRAEGRVAAGGFIILDDGERKECRSLPSLDRAYSATRMTNGIGAAKPR